jgi:hypothetical protein
MSAISAPHPRPKLDEPQPFTIFPEVAWFDPALTPRDRNLLGAILCWNRTEPRYLTHREMAERLGWSRVTVERCLSRIRAAGYLDLPAVPGARSEARPTYTTMAPRPRLARQKPADPQLLLPLGDPAELSQQGSARVSPEIHMRFTGDAGSEVPPAPPYKEASEKTTTDTPESSSSLISIHQEPPDPDRDPDCPEAARLLGEAESLFGRGMAGRVRDAILTFGLVALAWALGLVRRHNAKPGCKRIESWAWVLGALRRYRIEGPPPAPVLLPNLGQAREVLARLAEYGWGLKVGDDGRFVRVKLRPDATDWDLVRFIWRKIDGQEAAVRAAIEQGGSADVPAPPPTALPPGG